MKDLTLSIKNNGNYNAILNDTLNVTFVVRDPLELKCSAFGAAKISIRWTCEEINPRGTWTEFECRNLSEYLNLSSVSFSFAFKILSRIVNII